MNIENITKEVIEITQEASGKVMQVYDSGDYESTDKKDGSPVTRADFVSNESICKGLSLIDKSIPILSEEGDLETDKNVDLFWLVDPLDGTKEFINRNGEFTVNIALIDKGQPVMGVVSAPAIDELFYGISGRGSFKLNAGTKDSISPAKLSDESLRVTVSRSHQSEKDKNFIKMAESTFSKVSALKTGSSLKLCRVAEGAADIYCRFGPTYQWDIAAGQAVVVSCGGEVNCLQKAPLSYSFNSEKKNPEFYCVGDGSYDWERMVQGVN